MSWRASRRTALGSLTIFHSCGRCEPGRSSATEIESLWASSPTKVLGSFIDRLPSSYAALGPQGPNPRQRVGTPTRPPSDTIWWRSYDRESVTPYCLDCDREVRAAFLSGGAPFVFYRRRRRA